MVLNKRERTTAIVVGACFVLLGVYYFIVTPYIDSRDAQQKQIAKLQSTVTDMKNKRSMAITDQKDWDKMLSETLQQSPADASIQAIDDVTQLAQSCNVTVTAYRPENNLADDKATFNPETIRFTGTGTFHAVARLMYRLENPNFPVKVLSVGLSPHEKEGIDNLQVNLSVATIAYNKASETTNNRTNTPAAH